MLQRSEGQRLHLVLGAPWREALGQVTYGSSAAPELWEAPWDSALKKGDLVLTALAVEPWMFIVLETLSRSGRGERFLHVDQVAIFPRPVLVDAVLTRVGRKRLAIPSTLSDELADEVLDALEAELAEPTPSAAWEWRRSSSSSCELPSGLQLLVLRQSGGVCQGCERDFSELLDGRGLAALEVHHDDPLADSVEEEVVTSPERLVVACAACHRLLHTAGRPSLQEVRYAGRPSCPDCGARAAMPFRQGDQITPEDVVTVGCLRPPPGFPHWKCGACRSEWRDRTSHQAGDW